MTAHDEAARDTIIRHHAELVAGVRTCVRELADAVGAGKPHLLAWADLLAYLGSDILPHAAAEEDTLYPAAAAVGLSGQVEAMVGEHRQLEDAIEALARTTEPAEMVSRAEQLEALFTAHVAAENDVVLPALIDGDTGLAEILAAMHEAYHVAKRGTIGHRQTAADLTASLTAMLATALDALAEAGEADQACRLAADAWANLRGPRPELAAPVTTLLHRLVRRGQSEAIPVTAEAVGDEPELDVRELAPARRHQVIFTAYHALRPTACFVLVNDHDPKPLQYQFAAEHPGEYSWDYLQAGPRVWKVRVGKSAIPASA
jgi:uncharacterized protein (DUF2249 family)/iron-sulfur cluster repair protein YtfE (RIC family)